MLEYVGVLVTADSVRDEVETPLIADLAQATRVVVIGKRPCQLTTADAEAIYPYLVGKDFFPSMVRNMTLGPSSLYLVAGVDAFQRIRDAKGHFRQNQGDIEATGLRYRYRSGTRQELLDRGFTGQELLDRLNEFRLHTADTFTETLSLLSICAGESISQQLGQVVRRQRDPAS